MKNVYNPQGYLAEVRNAANDARYWQDTYLYDPSHTRIKETGPDGTTIYVNPRIDTGGHFEKTTKPDGSIEYKHYLYAGGQSIGVYTSRKTNGVRHDIKTVLNF